MRKFLLVFSLVILVAPIAAFADNAPSPAQTANAICKAAQTSMATKDFAAAYGTNASKSNAFGKCVSKNAKNAHSAVTNANASCQAQQADANFATSHDGKTFAQFYGKSGNGKSGSSNAFGKCVSQAVQSTVVTTGKASRAALKSCKALRKSNAAGFAQTYGAGKDALGKCVAAKSAPTP